jgi:hypothetical protein
VTFENKFPKILMNGIIPQKKQIWNNYMGAKLGKQVVYAYSRWEDAVRWAYRQTWHFRQKTVIVAFRENDEVMLRPETYISGEEFFKNGSIAPEQIVDVFDVNSEKMLRT